MDKKPSETLKQIREYHTNGLGICKNFENLTGYDLYEYLEKHDISLYDWPEFSGSHSYPVPGLGRNDNPTRDAYETYHECKPKWDKDTGYGQARYRLLDWLIDQLEAKGA